MFERMTDRARRVVVLAQEEARLLQNDCIDTEHILLGVIHESEGVGALALKSLDISLELVRHEVERLAGQGVSQELPAHIPFTDRSKKVLDLSLREALQLGHNYIGTEHLLLALVREGEGVAAQVLINTCGDLSKVRQRVIELLSGYNRAGDPPITLQLSRDAASALREWVVGIEGLMGPFATHHPARLLRQALDREPPAISVAYTTRVIDG